jgi:hypothetical protein
MTTQYNENYDGTMPFSDNCAQVGMSANSAQTVTVPGTSMMQYQALFSYNSTENVYVGLNATPTISVPGSVGTQAYSEFRPEKRYVKGGDVLHFITPDTTAYCGVSFRQLQG